MFVLIWATLLIAVSSNNDNADSGSYQLRLNCTLNGASKQYTSAQANITVQDLTQKPTVMVCPLTEGQQTTLTCTAPGLCSGSAPKITWTWRGAGEEDSHITGNITAFKTENVTAVTQRHSSTLMFNASAEHHGTKVTCKVSFTNNITTEETETLNVTYVKEVKITGNASVKEGEDLNLTCSVESFPPSLITWTKLGLNKNLTLDTGAATLAFSNVTAAYSGQYICTAKHLNNIVTKAVNITVTYMKKHGITGKTTVKEGDTLNLTCKVESFPPSLVMWTKDSTNKNLNSGVNQQNSTASATLVISNVTAEHTGQYICTAKHLDATLTMHATITVSYYPKILNSSGCMKQSEVLTCVCISQGFPLPTIKWPLLKKHTEYSVITTVSNHTVNSTATLTVKDHSHASVECISSSENGEATQNLTIDKVEQEKEEGLIMKSLRIVTRLEVIIVFLIGFLLSAIICCLLRKCHRKKTRIHGNLAETLEMVTCYEDPLIDAGHAMEDYQAIDQVAADAGGDVAAGNSDVEYSKINFSLIKKSPAEARTSQGTTETEYAEIKELKKIKEEAEARQEGEGEEETIEEDEETEHHVPEEKEGEDVALYSSVNDITSQI